jgi:hypothetical protein
LDIDGTLKVYDAITGEFLKGMNNDYAFIKVSPWSDNTVFAKNSNGNTSILRFDQAGQIISNNEYSIDIQYAEEVQFSSVEGYFSIGNKLYNISQPEEPVKVFLDQTCLAFSSDNSKLYTIKLDYDESMIVYEYDIQSNTHRRIAKLVFGFEEIIFDEGRVVVLCYVDQYYLHIINL